MAARRLAAVLTMGLWAGPAMALLPTEVFEKVAPSVWAVRALDDYERPFGFGSGVVIGPGRMITNCHVLAKAKSVQVRRENVSYGASLEHADTERDLCTLVIKGFGAPAVQIKPQAELKVGQRVYAIGNPLRLALTLSEGLISGLRGEDPKLPPIQTSASISQGSSGGGSFDDEGRLIGITTLIVTGRDRIAQNLNFAMPAEWIAEVPERAKIALATRRTSVAAAAAVGAPASPGLPAAGTSYRYRWADRESSRQQDFTVDVSSANASNVIESFSAQGEPGAASEIAVREPAFIARRLGDGRSMQEFAPYFPTDKPDDPQSLQPKLKYVTGGSAAMGPWDLTLKYGSWEQVVVPAGSFRALRVELRGSRQHTGIVLNAATRFEYTAWYVPEVKRYVKMRHQRWSPTGQVGDDNVELLEYRQK